MPANPLTDQLAASARHRTTDPGQRAAAKILASTITDAAPDLDPAVVGEVLLFASAYVAGVLEGARRQAAAFGIDPPLSQVVVPLEHVLSFAGAELYTRPHTTSKGD